MSTTYATPHTDSDGQPSVSHSSSSAASHHVRQAQQATHDHVSFNATDEPAADINLPQYPIRARRLDHDPLLKGIAAIGSDLGPTLIPMLQHPIPKGPENIGAPNCRSIKGINGSMVEVVPKQNLHITTVPLEYDMSSPMYPSSHQYMQSPISLQSPVGALHSPHGLRKPLLQPTMQFPPPPSMTAPPKPKKKAEGEFKTNFQFVVNEGGKPNGNSKAAKEARNTVRQHVMREFRRKERWDQGQNKVSKARKSAKKGSKSTTIKTEPQTPTLPRPDLHQYPHTESQTSSFQSEAPPRGASNTISEDGQQYSRSISMSDGSSSPASEPEKFAAMMTEIQQPQPSSPTQRTPFAPYLEQGLIIHPKDVEDAVEEIERTEYMPYQQDPWAEIARASINPFSRHLDASTGAASKALLHHYAWVMPSLMDEIVTGTVFHRIGWLYSSVAIHDPTPYHTIVGYTLGHIAMLRGLDEPPMAIEHKEKSLQLIKNRLMDPQQAASDASIGAITNIASYELIDCNPDRFAMHMQGLARLVTQRGGISDFAHNPALETVLIRLDTIRAYMTISQPRFPTWASLRNLTPLAIDIGPGGSDWFCPPASSDLHQFLFCEDAIRLIHGVEDVLMLMRSQAPFIPFTPDPSFRALLIDSLLHHMRRNVFNVPANFDDNICRRVLRLGAIVLIDLAAAEFFEPYSPPSPAASAHSSEGSPRSPLNNTLPSGNQNTEQPERKAGGAQAPKDRKGLGLDRLRRRFPSIEQNRHTWGRSVEMIVAVLMQAERMALERPFRAWYVADIVTLTMKLGLDEWRAVENALMADIMSRITEERREQQARGQMGQTNLNAQMEPTLVQYGYNPLPAWDMDETVRRFWNEWNRKVTP